MEKELVVVLHVAESSGRGRRLATLPGQLQGWAQEVGTGEIMDIFQRVVLKGSREMGCEEARGSSKGTGWRGGDREGQGAELQSNRWPVPRAQVTARTEAIA